jgi:hypothetical protein
MKLLELLTEAKQKAQPASSKELLGPTTSKEPAGKTIQLLRPFGVDNSQFCGIATGVHSILEHAT